MPQVENRELRSSRLGSRQQQDRGENSKIAYGALHIENLQYPEKCPAAAGAG
jgi:hypothetical protein